MTTRAKNKLAITAPADDPVIILTREFNAPRELVFAAYTRPEHLRRWWGPSFVEMTTCEVDLRPGGAWRYTFHKKPDGPPQTFKGVFQDIVPCHRLVYSFIYDQPFLRDHPAMVTQTFDEREGKTLMTEIVRHENFEFRDGHLNSGMEKGAIESLDQLENLLTTMPTSLTLNRTFNAPRDLVFKAWTERKHLERWWGPKGFTNPVCNVDVRPGGGIEIHMRGPDGITYPMRGEFKEIEPPQRLSFTAYAVGPSGEKMFEMLTTVSFAERGGKTEMSFETRAIMLTPDAAGPLSGMTQGWTESLEKLKAELEG